MVPAPTPRAERIDVLDVLRGLSLFGILLANVHVLSGLFFVDLVGQATHSAGDRAVLLATDALVDGKFYSLFSILFGVGAALFLSRAEARGADAGRLYRRRLVGLLVIGLAHALLVWSGDILVLYALLGFALPVFSRRSDRTVLRWAVGLLLTPLVLYAVLWALGAPDPMAPPEGGEGGFDFLGFLLGHVRGGYLDFLQANLLLNAGRWGDLLLTFRPPRVLGLFLLGLWIGRRGLAADLDAHAPLLRRVLLVGLAVGLPLNLAKAWLGETAAYLPATPAGMAQMAAYGVGVPLLALAYAAGVGLLFRQAAGRRALQVFAPTGRMALTTYLGQSLAGLVLFTGVGVGLFGRVGATTGALIAVGIFAVQVVLSALWFRRFRFGPVEWAWRSATYRARQPLRHPAPAAV